MQPIIDFLATCIDWFFALVMAILTTLVAMLEDLLAWALDELMGLAVMAVNACDCGFGTEWQATTVKLPWEILNVFWLLDIPKCLGIVICALIARFILQLVPMVRLGS